MAGIMLVDQSLSELFVIPSEGYPNSVEGYFATSNAKCADGMTYFDAPS